jgi:hypothetical protein
LKYVGTASFQIVTYLSFKIIYLLIARFVTSAVDAASLNNETD